VVIVNRNVLTVAHGAMCPIQTTCDAPKMCKRAKEHHCPHEAARNEKGSDEKPRGELLWYRGHRKGV
jgi:hypothetical protein